MKIIWFILLTTFSVNSFAQSEIELNMNAPIIPLGNYAKSNLFYGMETIGYAKIGYGVDFKYLYKIKNSRIKVGANINYFQNAYKSKRLDFAYKNHLGCNQTPFVCGFQNYFGWDSLYKVTDWKALDFNLITSVNVLKFKRIQYNVLLGGGVSMLFSPKYYYNISFDEELNAHTSFNFTAITEQNLKIEIIKKLFFNASLFYRISKVHSKFTKNLISEYTYYDFWQHTIGTRIGFVLQLNHNK